jgi:flagellar hook assembly protein FlgD
MDLVYSKRKNINRMGGKVFVSWDGMDSDGEKLPSGVYIYVTKSDQDTKKGKLVIQNE